MIASAAAVSASLVTLPSPAAAATYHFTVTGAEVYPTSTSGRFVGTATGSATGTWYATVNHTPVSTGGGRITGGSFSLLLGKNAPAHVVKGHLASGTMTLDPAHTGANCTDQVYTVSARLAQVTDSETGRMKVTLTHHYLKTLGKCLPYAATVSGTLTLTR
jgi:hypothetical protein